ncbi:hypothetical protein FA95DRAFT_1212715 [Auriscalpium vulgare]|uniref:Uncharacterized protein n=1 Tax=Auriscalpium vulgare TaxID=40419 RepID=A0ACB8RVA1_9AGAM|nr:hypothetical protein FA95DRAFT_1212715 [Auriscalpium vulgare]
MRLRNCFQRRPSIPRCISKRQRLLRTRSRFTFSAAGQPHIPHSTGDRQPLRYHKTAQSSRSARNRIQLTILHRRKAEEQTRPIIVWIPGLADVLRLTLIGSCIA